ncbi:TetR/AcrR family transcriptional regulator [Coraliomargarita sp. W4R53]
MIPSPPPEGSVSDKTRQRILQAAGKIFAHGGYRAMTLREVTKQADVNLAAVNYHFGSKSNLMRELIHAHFEPINQQRLDRLDQLVSEHAPAPVPLEAIFDALFRPLFTGIESTQVNDTTLMQIIGRMVTEPADFMSNLHKEFFAELSKRFMIEIKRTCPELSHEQLQYRFFLSISTMSGTIIGEVRLEIILGSKLNGSNLDRVLKELTAYVVAGFQQK